MYVYHTPTYIVCEYDEIINYRIEFMKTRKLDNS